MIYRSNRRTHGRVEGAISIPLLLHIGGVLETSDQN